MRQLVRTLGPVLVSVFSSPVMAQTAQQFDVICTMQINWRATGSDAGSGAEQQLRRFSVDLAAMRYCLVPCVRVAPLRTDNVDSELDLSHSVDDQSGRAESATYEFRINRLTGTATSLFRKEWPTIDSSLTERGTGTCRREPFSGFPEALF